jgi:Superinfection immunity protein
MLIMLFVVCYFIPTFIALKHSDLAFTFTIFVNNLLWGWTVIGWFGDFHIARKGPALLR